MKEAELRKHATCSVCGNRILAAGMPLFWTVRIERHGVKLDAVRRQQGLTMMLGGNAAIAAAMGADEDMTMPMMEPVTATVCDSCGTEMSCVAALAEVGSNAELRGRPLADGPA